MDSIRRPFATGSKPGPDAVDHYLEEKGFYRKHVARDASSLFRVVSEQVFDIQNYHERIRQDCSAFMEAHKDEYANDVDKNFFNYVSQMRRSRTHGSLLELRVLARMYRKNVILFEPTQNLQTTSYVYVNDDSYDSNEPLRVFFSQKDKHFDVIYTMDYAQRLAHCQAIVYDLLYSDVFKLPDVQYAVERMLHDQEEQVTLPLSEDPSKYTTQSGEIFAFDSHTMTECVLKDPKTCHFHNQDDFEEVVNERKSLITVINQKNEPGRMKIFKPIDGFLYDMNKSCVRQLLAERITPFPYKVAKALDPSIYRNTEFELWSENRKEQRLKWLDSADYSSKPYCSEKWCAYDYDRYNRGGMKKFYDGKIERTIVDELTYLSLDDDLKKKYIILNSTEPFKIQDLSTNMDHFLPSRDSTELTVMPVNTNHGRGGFKKRGGGRPNIYNSNVHHMHSSGQNQYHSSSHQVPQPQMTHLSDIEREATYYQEQDTQPYFQQQQISTSFAEASGYEQIPAPMYQPISQFGNQLVPVQFAAAPFNYQHVKPYGNFTMPPPILPPQFPILQSATSNAEIGSGDGGDLMNILREAELSSTTINWKPKESTDPSDLPINDIPTLQFYYNLGVRYFLATGVQRRLEGVAQQLENIELNDTTAFTKNIVDNAGEKVSEQKAVKVKTDPPPVPANTPVSTKSTAGNYGPPGHRYAHNSAHNNFRRPFGVNRDTHRESTSYRGSWNNQPRKEIKFNSNVRNANKVDAKTGIGSHSSGIQTVLYQGNGESTNDSGITVTTLQDKSSLKNNLKLSTSQYSPVLTAQESQPVQIVDQTQQYYQSYPGPHTYVQPHQQGVGMVYQIAEDGSSYVVQQVPQPMQYSHPYPYAVPSIQPGQIYYPVHSYPPVIDGSTLSSNDSGVVDTNIYQCYPQSQLQYYPAPQPVPMYFAPSPVPQTPQIAPLFPLPPQHQQVPLQTAIASQAFETLSPKTSDDVNTDNATSA